MTGTAAVTIPAGITTTITNLVINGASASVTLNQAYTFQDVTVTSGILTGAAYNNSNSGGAWTSTPGTGNGRLIMTVNGTLTVGTTGRIHMDSKGYIGGTATRTQSGSPTGPGTSASTANGGGGGGVSTVNIQAGGGSYGTRGLDSTAAVSTYPVAGTTYGASDFDTQLYLGAGGGGNSAQGTTGGYGGGAIKLTVGNLSLASGAQISSTGGSPSSTGSGGGSGGTIVIDLSGTFTNSGGTISVAGGTSAWGSSGGSGRIKFPQAKLIDASNNLSVAGFSLIDINLTSNVNTLTVGANATVNLTASNNVTVSSLVINGANAELRLNDEWTQASRNGQPALGKSFGSITVTNGVLTSNAYSNTFSGGAWSTTPAAGNGQLIVDVTGTLTVGTSGRIHMDSKGYIGGTSLRTQGGSLTGPGTSASTANGGGGGGVSTVNIQAGGGSYGTQGLDSTAAVSTYPVAGTTYGASDFDTQLYLGAGGGGNSAQGTTGGYGGGAIKLNVGNLTLNSGAQISSKGGGPSSTGSGAGAGGTIVIDVSGTFSNSSGTISVVGGTSAWGSSGGSGRLKFPQAKLIDASNNLSVAGFSLIDINLTSNINTFTVGANATVNLSASNNVTVSSLVINGANAELRLNDEWTQASRNGQPALGKSFGSITVTNGVLTSNPYSNTFSGSTWSTTPAAGNGQLIVDVTGTLTVGTSGRIHMDSKGYIGGTATRTQGGSPTGTGTNSTSANGGGGGGNASNGWYAGGGSYGTAGTDLNSAYPSYPVAGTTYGASDFDTQLYLGAGGGGNSLNAHTGGYGGGAIKLNVANLSIASGGQISSRGGSPSSVYGGAGAGGTVVIDISGTYSNSGGTISIAGGTSAWGINGGSGRLKFPQAKLIDASNNLSVVGFSLYDINLTSNINTFTVGANATVNLTASNNVTISSLVINGANAELRLNDEWTQASRNGQPALGKSFGSITVTNGVLTSNAYSNTYSGSSWSTTPAAGNGQLIIDVTGTLTVGASGRVHMDSKGYMGGTSTRTQGGSPTGPGTSSTSANGGGGGGNTSNGWYAGGGSYGTAGTDLNSAYSSYSVAGTTYGASDFDTQLYLGAGGGGNSLNAHTGGYGGGAIKLNVASLSLASGAQITAKGGAPSGSYAAGGAGGTTVIDVSGTFTNSGGTISVAGDTTYSSRTGGSGRIKFPQAKLIDASNNLSIAGFSLFDINLTSNINTFTVGANATVNLTGSNNVTVSSLVINGANAELRVNDQWTTATFGKSFGSITVTNGVLTSNPYSNTFSGSSWSTTPAAGNGQLILDVTGSLTVSASGRINMDSKGYIGGTSTRTQGGSPTGPGTTSTSANGGGGGGATTNAAYGGGGSYGTAGAAGTGAAGTTYGSSDFTTQLYLGSGGGANSFNGNPGGYGGGAIKLSIGSGSVASGGQITARGGATGTYSGGGSGGTVVITSTGAFTNGGTLSVAGGTGTRAGGSGRSQP